MNFYPVKLKKSPDQSGGEFRLNLLVYMERMVLAILVTLQI